MCIFFYMLSVWILVLIDKNVFCKNLNYFIVYVVGFYFLRMKFIFDIFEV